MKIYNKLGIFAATALLSASCAVNDPFADYMEMGEVVPTVSWELNSAVCKAGNEAGFLGKYYNTEEGVAISHSEVWGMITRSESAAATCKLVSSPAYTQTVNLTDTVRGFHLLATFPHSEEYLDGKEYHLEGAFPTSRTLAPISWANVTEWDDATFGFYYPADFKETFRAKMVGYLTDTDSYLSSLRAIYSNFGFTKEQFDELNNDFAGKIEGYQPLPFSDSEVQGETMGDLWYDPVLTDTIGYYCSILVDGVLTEMPCTSPEDGAEKYGVDKSKVFPVFNAPHWLYCRYSDNTGGAVTSMKEEYRQVWRALLENYITFEDWIYNGADQNYAVEFTRKYTIVSQFKVIDSKGGVGRDTDLKYVELN